MLVKVNPLVSNNLLESQMRGIHPTGLVAGGAAGLPYLNQV